jgi:hypothetical protein
VLGVIVLLEDPLGVIVLLEDPLGVIVLLEDPLGVIVLLEDPLAAKFQPLGRGNQNSGKNVLVLSKVYDAVDLNKDLRTSGNKIAPLHHRSTTIFYSTYGVIFCV